MPVVRLKNLPKKLCVGKLRMVLISCILHFFSRMRLMASPTTYSAIHSLAFFPL